MAKKKSRRSTELAEQPGNTELEVLRVIWANGPMSAREIANQLEQKGQNWADTTVHTLLTRLRKKQLVDSQKENGVLIFRALVAEQQLAEHSIDQILGKFDGVAALPIVKALINSQSLTDSEIEELHKLVEDYSKKSKGNSRRKSS
jgi:BlaI family transcriptional regulator, penicillinase repressor